jgi:hypothetical protein
MTIPTLLLVSLLAIPACAVDDGSGEDDLGDVDTGTTEQAVTGTSVRTFTSTAFGMTTWNDIASGPGTACFLAGVDGNMQAANSNESLLGVYPAGDQWYVTIYNNANHPVSITVACVSGVTNVTDQIFWHGTADTWQSGTANTHCFLTSIGGANHGFSQFDDDVRIDKGFGNNWRFHGTIATANGFMDARMVCFDATYGEGAWGGAWTAMGTVGGPLASNAAGGVACGLTGLGGDFGFSNLSSGVKITYDRLNTQWAWTLSDIKQGSVECIK